MIQIFVKVDGGKTSVMEIEMSDKVDDIVKKILISDQDVYVTSGGRTLRRSEQQHEGQLQLHSNKGDLQDLESQHRNRSRKCHGIQGRIH